MDWKIVYADRTHADLQKITERIARDDPAAAFRFGSLLIDKAESLASAPEMGPMLPRKPGTRFFPVGSYLIIYRLVENQRVVRVLRFWHASRRDRPTR